MARIQNRNARDGRQPLALQPRLIERHSGPPGDLGYFIGYRIAEAYYAKQADKVAALRDIIEIRNADDFLTRSGYSP